MRLFELAWRNVLRNRRRSLLTMAAVAVGGCAMVCFGGYVAATTKALQTDTVRQVGHLQVMQPGYLDFGRGNPGRYALRDYAQVLQLLQGDAELKPMLKLATPMLQIQGVAGNFAQANSSNFLGTAWLPADRRQMLEWDGHGLRLPPGASRLREDQAEAGVIGVGLAQLLGLCERLQARHCVDAPAPAKANGPAIGADLMQLSQQADAQASPVAAEPASVNPQIELLVASAHGVPNVARMQVLRTERQGAREYDAMYASMPLPMAQNLLFGPDERGATSVVVQLHSSAQLPAAMARVQALMQAAGLAVEVKDFMSVNPQYGQVIAMFTVLFRVIAVLMAIVTLFSVANAINMSISERVNEIGSLRALGFKRRHIRRLFLIEGLLIGLLGSAMGVLLGVLLSEYGINQAGWTWTPPGRAQAVPLGIDTLGQPALLAGVVGLLALLACASAWWPARRASRLEIVEALRHA